MNIIDLSMFSMISGHQEDKVGADVSEASVGGHAGGPCRGVCDTVWP